MTKKWYERDLRRILVDMHIPDWNERFFSKFDADAYADLMARANITCAEIYAGNSLGICLFPTERGYAHKQLKGRDFFGEAVDACHRRGIDVQAYFSFWATKPYDLHPEFRMVLEDGTGTKEFRGGMRWGLCCMNSPFAEYFLAELDEINTKYDISAFWIDMFGWFGRFCYCDSCRKKWRQESGLEIPRAVDWNDPDFNRYVRWREKCMSDLARRIVKTVTDKHPERTVNIQAAGFSSGWLQAMDEQFVHTGEFLAGDFTGNAQQQSYISKMYSAFSKNRPMEFMTPRCEDLAQHTTERTLDNLTMRAYAAIANQSSFTLIDAIDPEGTMDSRFYEHAAIVNGKYAAYEKYISGKSQPLADVAFFHSFTSQINEDVECPLDVARRHEAATSLGESRYNWIEILQGGHLLFSYTGRMLGNLEKFPVIILSDACRMTDEECAMVRTYVANGGRLYASYGTSLFDPATGIRDDFALAKVFGVHFKGKTAPRNYIAPTKDSLLGEFATERYPMMLDTRQCILEADGDAIVEGTLTLPISGPDEKELFGSGISDPPLCPKGTPALVRHRYGKGEVIYCAGQIENASHPYHYNVLRKIIRELRGQQFVETNAPACVEITAFDQRDEKRVVVSLLNLPQQLPAIPVHDIAVKLNLPDGIQPEQVLLAPGETPVPFVKNGNTVEFSLAKLTEFCMLIVTYK